MLLRLQSGGRRGRRPPAVLRQQPQQDVAEDDLLRGDRQRRERRCGGGRRPRHLGRRGLDGPERDGAAGGGYQGEEEGRGSAQGGVVSNRGQTLLFLSPGADGPGLPEPGEEPPGPGSAAGLRGPGPLPAGGQPVAGLLLVLPQPAGHVGRRRHSDLHAEAPVP